MTLSRPVLAGVTLRRPSSWNRTPGAVESTVELADGTLTRYHRGHRLVFTLSWDTLTEQDAAAVDALSVLTGPVQYVDLDGTSYAVLVTGWDGSTAIPGTDPVRYSAGLTLTEQAPRMTMPPASAPAPVGDAAANGGIGDLVVDPGDADVLLVSSGTIDPADPEVLILGAV